MTDSAADKIAFGRALKDLGLVFGQPVDAPFMRAYFQVLRDLPLEAFLSACAAATAKLRWYPKPAELLELAGAGATAMKAAIAAAWEAVRGAMTRYDYLYTVDFGPLVNAVVRNLGGWQRLCNCTERELIWERKKFEEVCELFMNSRTQLRGEPLPGKYYAEPVRIAIGGRLPPLQIEAVASPVQSVVRQLAESKAVG